MEENGKLEIDNFGTKIWKLNGRLHNTDGPAIEWVDGEKEWYVNDKRHRLDGPAIEWGNRSKQWYVNGKRHRVDGPAIEYANGDKSWHVNGDRFPTDEVDQWVEDNNLTIPFNEETQVLFKLRWL